jgi:hypothetical protein
MIFFLIGGDIAPRRFFFFLSFFFSSVWRQTEKGTGPGERWNNVTSFCISAEDTKWGRFLFITSISCSCECRFICVLITSVKFLHCSIKKSFDLLENKKKRRSFNTIFNNFLLTIFFFYQICHIVWIFRGPISYTNLNFTPTYKLLYALDLDF